MYFIFSLSISDFSNKAIPRTYQSPLVQAGVPQGSILGLLQFLLYINDIVNAIGANIRLFADKTSLYTIVENPAAAALCLNNDLGKISRWASLWLVTLNPV